MAQSERPGEGTRLQTAAFEAINDVVRVATADTLPLVVQLIPLFISKLSSTLHLQAASAESTERQSEIQARAGSAHPFGTHLCVSRTALKSPASYCVCCV